MYQRDIIAVSQVGTLCRNSRCTKGGMHMVHPKTLRMSLRITELVNCKYTGRSHLEFNHHKLTGYRVGTLSMCSQCIHNVPGGGTDPCPQ